MFDSGPIPICAARKNNFFTLADVVGTSGAAPAKKLREKGLTNLGFPEFRHWSIHSLDKRHAEYQHGDGGFADNLGIMPQLARQTKNILVFINSPRPFDLFADSDGYDSRLGPLFGFAGTPKPDSLDAAARDTSNQVFGSEGLSRLIAGLRAGQKKGGTLIHFDEYDVLANHRYGIQPYERVRVVWIYNSDVPTWRDSLPDSVREDLRRLSQDGEFEDFPNYPTFKANTGNVIDLSREQVNALAHLSCWNVTENERRIKSHLRI